MFLTTRLNLQEGQIWDTGPIATGVQGLADTLVLLGFGIWFSRGKLDPKNTSTLAELGTLISSVWWPFENEFQCQQLNINHMKHKYHGNPVSKACSSAGFCCNSWCINLSIILQGILQLTCGVQLQIFGTEELYIFKNGVRNSLIVAPIPTASTSQILGNNEHFEPHTSNI